MEVTKQRMDAVTTKPINDNNKPHAVDGVAMYFCLAVYMLAVLPHFFSENVMLSMLCLVLTLWRLHLVHTRASPPSSNTTTVVGVIAISILGGLTQFTLSPQYGVIALMILLGCKNLGATTNIQLSNNLLLLPFIPMGFFLTNDPSWGNTYLLVFVWAWLTALHRIWSRPVPAKTTIRHGTFWLLGLAPLVLIAYFLLPRPGMQWTEKDPQGQTGMSSTLRPGDVGRLSQNPKTAFVATFNNMSTLPMPASAMYWRGMTLPQYNNGIWSGSDTRRLLPPAWVDNQQANNGVGTYEVFQFEKKDRFIYTLEHSVVDNAIMLADATAAMPNNAPVQEFRNYKAIWLGESTLSIQPQPFEQGAIQNDNPRATQLAIELRARYHRPQDFVRAIQDYIVQNNFTYSLEPGSMTKSWVDKFLFERRIGFCEHYAGSVAYLMRQAGFASRVVVGFQGGRDMPSSSLSVDVPFSAAHAWLEYWDPVGNAWVHLDPTAWVAPDRLTTMHWNQPTGRQIPKWMNELSFLASSFDAQWKMWVTYYDASQQRQLWHKMGNVDWTSIVFSISILAFLVWMMLRQRWQMWSPLPLHQLKWLQRAEKIHPSATLSVLKTHLLQKNHTWLQKNTWFDELQIALYQSDPKRKTLMFEWLVFLMLYKSTTYKNYMKSLKFFTKPLDTPRSKI